MIPCSQPILYRHHLCHQDPMHSVEITDRITCSIIDINIHAEECDRIVAACSVVLAMKSTIAAVSP